MKLQKLETVRVGARSVVAYVDAVKEGLGVMPSKKSPKVANSNSRKSSKIFVNQKEAVAYAREVAMKYQSELSIHGNNGKIKEKFVHGDYSFPPRG